MKWEKNKYETWIRRFVKDGKPADALIFHSRRGMGWDFTFSKGDIEPNYSQIYTSWSSKYPNLKAVKLAVMRWAKKNGYVDKE